MNNALEVRKFRNVGYADVGQVIFFCPLGKRDWKGLQVIATGNGLQVMGLRVYD